MPGQVVDVVPSIGEPAPGAVEVAEPCRRGDHALETANQPGLGGVARGGSRHGCPFVSGIRGAMMLGIAGGHRPPCLSDSKRDRRGQARRPAQTPTIRSTVFWIWAMSTGFEIIEPRI